MKTSKIHWGNYSPSIIKWCMCSDHKSLGKQTGSYPLTARKHPLLTIFSYFFFLPFKIQQHYPSTFLSCYMSLRVCLYLYWRNIPWTNLSCTLKTEGPAPAAGSSSLLSLQCSDTGWRYCHWELASRTQRQTEKTISEPWLVTKRQGNRSMSVLCFVFL